MSEINMTPLIDVMLVLLVIFIITAPLLVSTVKVDLPQSGALSASHPPHVLKLTVDRAGALYLDDRAANADELQAALSAAYQANPQTEIQLRADAGVPYGRVVAIMGMAHKAGLHRIGFVAQEILPPRSTAAPLAAPLPQGSLRTGG